MRQLKTSFRQRQLKAAVAVNSELLTFYWQLGGEIVEKQQQVKWGQGFLTQLSKDLMSDFPDISGFSKRKLEHIRKWYRYWAKTPQLRNSLLCNYVSCPGATI